MYAVHRNPGPSSYRNPKKKELIKIKTRIIKIIAALLIVGIVIALAFAIKAGREKDGESGNENTPASDGFRDPDRLPDWDLT